jgi:hypothetical protein
MFIAYILLGKQVALVLTQELIHNLPMNPIFLPPQISLEQVTIYTTQMRHNEHMLLELPTSRRKWSASNQ